MKEFALRLLLVAFATFVFLALTPSSALAADEPSEPAQLFKSHCAVCHGADGSGETLMGKKLNLPDLRSDEVQNTAPAELAKIIAEGKGKMAAYRSRVTAAQIDGLVKLIKTMKK